MKRQTLTVIALAAMVVLTTATLAAAPVSAQTEDSDSGGLDAETVDAFVSGLLERFGVFTDEPEQATATEYAQNIKSTLNQNSTELTDWTNARTNASTATDTVRVKVQDDSGGVTYLFAVADVNSTTGNYTNFRVLNQSGFRAVDRDVDTTVRLSADASRKANDELETFIRDYAAPGNDLNKSYIVHMGTEYRGEVTGELIPGGDD